MKKTKKPKAPTEYCILFVNKIPRSIKNAFKATASARGMTMRDALIDAMRDCTDDEFQIITKDP